MRVRPPLVDLLRCGLFDDRGDGLFHWLLKRLSDGSWLIVGNLILSICELLKRRLNLCLLFISIGLFGEAQDEVGRL